MLDQTDRDILALLRADGRMQWREIGERVHLSGPAVASRIARMEREGVLRGFTVRIDDAALGQPIRAYVSVSMKSTRHAEFRDFCRNEPMIRRADRISGQCCYLLTVAAVDADALNAFLERVLAHGNYSVNLSMGAVKESGED